jgi:hypothetical protein
MVESDLHPAAVSVVFNAVAVERFGSSPARRGLDRPVLTRRHRLEAALAA